MSGLLAANMLRKQSPLVIEKQNSLPNNHSALLRFRSDAVSNATGIPFKKVFVRKQINYHGELLTKPTIPIANEYCEKVTGKFTDRSIWNLDPAYRTIAPNDFISQLAKGCDVQYNSSADFLSFDKSCPIISTIPMYDLMKILGWEDAQTMRKIPEFEYRSIWSLTFDICDPFVDLYQTTYYPNKRLPFYRMSITGKRVIMEFLEEPQLEYEWKGEKLNLMEYCYHFLKHDFGIDLHGQENKLKVSHQKYGKLIPIDDKLRKEFISWATHNFNVYSLGRWATHRQLLMDDVVNDINVINNLIQSGNYNR